MSGNYGELRIESARNADMTTIAAAQGQKPTFTRVMVDDSTRWTLRGLHVIGEDTDFLIELGGNNENLRVENCVVMSTADASRWSARDWIDRASSGIRVSGMRMTIRESATKPCAHVRFNRTRGRDRSTFEPGNTPPKG